MWTDMYGVGLAATEESLGASGRDSSLLSLQLSALENTHSVMFMAGYLLKIQVPTVQLKQDEPREKSIPE